MIGGDGFKSGQTKMKSVLVEFFLGLESSFVNWFDSCSVMGVFVLIRHLPYVGDSKRAMGEYT